jgi:hypothetical protein
MSARRAVGAAAAVLLLAGCAAGAAPSTIRPPIEITHPHAQLSCPDVPIEHLPDDLVNAEVVSVFHCSADYHEVQGVMNKVQYISKLKDDPSALLEAYSAPDEPPTDRACTKDYRDPLIIWVEVRPDEFVAAHAPLDECGKPQQAAAEAFEAADFVEVLVAREVGEDAP